MDILDENVEKAEKNEAAEKKKAEKVEESTKIWTAEEYDKLLEDEIKQHLVKNGKKLPNHKCSRCGNDLGTVDQWFNYAIKPVHFGYTMIPQPLCKSCFKDFEAFMHAFDKK